MKQTKIIFGYAMMYGRGKIVLKNAHQVNRPVFFLLPPNFHPYNTKYGYTTCC